MEAQNIARKRKLKKSNWDAKLDEGKRKKVKAKKVEGEDLGASNLFGRSNPFFRKQAKHMRMGGSKGQGGDKDAKRRKR